MLRLVSIGLVLGALVSGLALASLRLASGSSLPIEWAGASATGAADAAPAGNVASR
jgi:hypothetical protein